MSGPGAPWATGSITILGQLGSKSNSRRIIRRGGRLASIKSEDALRWWHDALRQGPKPAKPFEGNVRLLATCYYADRRRDLDIALLQDLLQVGSPKNPGLGLIRNDRQVVEIHAWRRIDKERPRVVFRLEEVKA